jgi:hypothetical protein
MDGDNAIEALARAIETSFGGIRPVQKASTADLNLGTADTALPGIALPAVTPEVTEIWTVIANVYMHATVIGFGDATLDLYANGAIVGLAGTMVYSPPAVPHRMSVAMTWLLAAAAGVPTTLELRAKKSVAGGTVQARIGSRLTLQRFPNTQGTLRELLGDAFGAGEALPAEAG